MTSSDCPGEHKGGGYQGQCWTCSNVGHTSSECRWRVASIDEEDADCRNSGGRLKAEEDGEVGSVWIVGNVEEHEGKKAQVARSLDPSTGHMKINAMHCVKFVKDSVTGGVNS